MAATRPDPGVLVVTAMQREAAALRALGAIACGTGDAAAMALKRQFLEHPPELVIIAGVCGGLDPSLRPGDIILGRRVLAANRPDLPPPEPLFDVARKALLHRHERFISSALITVPTPLETRQQRTDAWNASGAGGVDMETYQLAACAEESRIRWLAVRAVLDPSSDDLPSSLQSWSGEPDRDVAARALRHPLEWPAYARLALQMRASLASLRRAVPVVAAAAAAALNTHVADASQLEIPLIEIGARPKG